jgi:hypothetical protein
LAAQLTQSPVQRLLKDYRGACVELLGREPAVLYSRDGALLKRLLVSFSEERIVEMFRRFLRECQQHRKPFTVLAFYAAAERLAQSREARS